MSALKVVLVVATVWFTLGIAVVGAWNVAKSVWRQFQRGEVA